MAVKGGERPAAHLRGRPRAAAAGEGVRVAWVSRHPPLPAQLERLRRVFGEGVEVVQISRTFATAEEVAEAVRAAGARAAVVVLPLSMIARLLEAGRDIAWLWAEMSALHECYGPGACPEFNPETDVWLPLHGSQKGRHMRFNRFMRIKAVKLELEPLEEGGG